MPKKCLTGLKDGPVGCSTPRGPSILAPRRGLHDHKDNSMVSPISKDRQTESESSMDDGLSDSEEVDLPTNHTPNEETLEDRPIRRTLEGCQIPTTLETRQIPRTFKARLTLRNIYELFKQHRFLVVIASIAVSIYLIMKLPKQESMLASLENIEPASLENIESLFPKQSRQFWQAFNSGIHEIETFHKPSVFILLYEANSETTIDKLVNTVSHYGVCKIKKNCALSPIVLSKEVLNTESAIADYGILIEEYKGLLEKQGVMVVHNLQEIRGTVAQVFHSMCDEYDPLVPETLFIFTMKIEKFPEVSKSGDLGLVERVLQSNWKEIKDDIFQPLLTRISSMILRVSPET